MQQSKLPHPDEVISDAFNSLEIRINHEAECLQETEFWLANPGLDDPSLDDLTALPFVTIDNDDSMDLDQALLIEKSAEGYRLRYALADAAYYIKPGSALFNASLQRGTTYYAPGTSAPMLPRALSEGLISLNPHTDRRALVFDMNIDADTTVTRCSIVRARIHSQAKLSYRSVQAWLDNNELDTKPYHLSLRLLQTLGEQLIKAGEERGVIRFDRTETRLSVLGSPPHLEAGVRERYDTERYNEQISLICNMQGARMLLAMAGVSNVQQAVYRVHEAPLRKNLKRLRQTISELAETQTNPELWHWPDKQSLAHYVECLPDDKRYSRQVRAIQRQIMQAQRASTFQPEPGEHHALKASSYARFSSPMREVVGIFTHKELLESLSGKAYDNKHDEILREQVIEAANNARRKQRKLDKTIEFAALYSIFSRELRLHQAPTHVGTIMGMRSRKLFLNLDDMALDVKVYFDDLENIYNTTYTINGVEAHPADTECPIWRLGRGIRLQINGYDKARKRFAFSIELLEGY